MPYHPSYLSCQRTKGIVQHCRRRADALESEMQADFFFVKSSGETSTREIPNSIRCLALKECFSGSIGCVVMDGNVDSCRRVLIQTPGFHFLVQRAGPQVHEAVGHVERCVRSIKEGIAVTREELRENGLNYQISHESLKDLCRYVCHMHNQFSRAHGSSKSPKEIAVGRDLNTTHVSAFLSQVLVLKFPKPFLNVFRTLLVSLTVSICFQAGCHRAQTSLVRSSVRAHYSLFVLLRSQSK